MRKRLLIKACTRTKSTDFEDISMDSISNVIPVISKHHMHICNSSFKTGVFPSRMQIDKIKLIFKSGEKKDIGNDKPGSLLPQFSKIVPH